MFVIGLFSFFYILFFADFSFAAIADDRYSAPNPDSFIRASQTYVSSNERIDHQKMLELSRIALKGRDIRCIVCYAWNEDHNHPYNQFAQRIAHTLSQAGVLMYLDLKNLNVGDNIEEYIQKISDPNYFVILLITPLVADRCRVNECDLKPGEQLPWIKKEVMRIADRLVHNNFFYIPIVLGNSLEDIKGHEFITTMFYDHIRTRKPGHSKQEYLYMNFSDEERYHTNVLEIITRKFAVDPKTVGGLPNPVVIQKDDNYYNTLSIYDHLCAFVFDYIEPNAIPIVAVLVSGYFGIRQLNNHGV